MDEAFARRIAAGDALASLWRDRRPTLTAQAAVTADAIVAAASRHGLCVGPVWALLDDVEAGAPSTEVHGGLTAVFTAAGMSTVSASAAVAAALAA